jgi:hypothetical protein
MTASPQQSRAIFGCKSLSRKPPRQYTGSPAATSLRGLRTITFPSLFLAPRMSNSLVKPAIFFGAKLQTHTTSEPTSSSGS